MQEPLAQTLHLLHSITVWKSGTPHKGCQLFFDNFPLLDLLSCLSVSSPLSPVPRGTACPLFPGNASYSPQPAAGEWSTETHKIHRVNIVYTHTHMWENTHAHTRTRTYLAELLLVLRHLLQHLGQIPHCGLVTQKQHEIT